MRAARERAASRKAGLARAVVIDATLAENVVDGHLVVPHGGLIVDARYERLGADLCLIGTSGFRVIVAGYFARAEPVNLASEDGALVSAAVVHALARSNSRQPGQDMQVAGEIGAVAGAARIVQADGATTAAMVGASLYAGDAIETPRDSGVIIRTSDGTAVSLEAESRLVIGMHQRSRDGVGLFLLKGSLNFEAGEPAMRDDRGMILNTPFAAVGVRGSRVVGRVETEADECRVMHMPHRKHMTGRLVVGNQAGYVVLASARQSTIVTDANLEPSDPLGLEQSTDRRVNGHDPARAPSLADGLASQLSEDDLVELFGETDAAFDGRGRRRIAGSLEARRDARSRWGSD